MLEKSQFAVKSAIIKKIAVIPACRDTTRLLKVLANFKEKVVDEICVVIDCASDTEIGQVRNANSAIDIHVISSKKRRGVGTAIREGIRYATQKQYDVVVVLAGNGKDQPDEIQRLLRPIVDSHYDYVQGSRFLSGGRTVRNPFLRRMFSRLYPFVWTMFTKKNCTDVTNGFRAYKLSMFCDPQIDINQSWLDRYELEYYIHYKALTLGYKVLEVPVSKIYPFSHKGGYSRISPLRDWWQIVGPLLYLKIGLKK